MLRLIAICHYYIYAAFFQMDHCDILFTETEGMDAWWDTAKLIIIPAVMGSRKKNMGIIIMLLNLGCSYSFHHLAFSIP